MTIRRTALAAVACGALALAACSSDTEAEETGGEYHGFETEAEYTAAIDAYACDEDRTGATFIMSAYNTIREDPELSERYGIPRSGDPSITHQILYGDTTPDCDTPWVRAGLIKEIENRGYFDRDYAIEEGVIEE